MRKIVLIGSLLLYTAQSQAQEGEKQKNEGSIVGNITDSLSKKPIEYATITLFREGNKKAVNGTVTDKGGQFTVSLVDPGTYKVVIESVGYRPYTINAISITKKDPVVKLPAISLAKSQVTLSTVTVTSSTPLIENKINKVVFNAEKDLTSQGGVATDVLKKIPQVSVDVDGNVELAGSASIKFLINGKPSTAFGSSIADVLQSIPASQIKSIEVITNPGAKYDAQGLGGIINIILKQSKVKGINGNMSLTAGTRNENGSFNFNARRNDLGFNAFISGNSRLSATLPTTSERLSVDTAAQKNISLQQDGNSRRKSHGMETGFGFDWTYKKKNNFTGSFRYGNFGRLATNEVNQLQVVTAQNGGAIQSSIASINTTNDKPFFYSFNVDLDYKRTFAKEDQELEVSVNSSFDKSHGIASNYQLLLPQDSLYYGTNSSNPGHENETEIAVDYTQPLKEDVNFGIGTKMVFTDINGSSIVDAFEPSSKLYLFDTSLSNALHYKQKVYGLYGEISFPVGHLFETKLGGRYERTEISSFFSNAQQQAGTHGYNTFVPSVFFQKKLGEKQAIKLSYSKRIERPDYNALNPFINTTDPKNISAGNPYLTPELGHRFELSYNRSFKKSGSFSITAFYRINEHDIQPFIVFYPSLKVGDSVYTNVAVSTRQNIGSEKNMGTNMFVDLHLNDKLTIRSNLSAFRRHTINVLDPGFNYNSFNYRFNMNASYQFTKTLAGEFFGNFNSARHEAQGTYPSFTSYSVAVRKQFWNKKASLAFSATNPFSEYVDQRSKLFGSNFTVNSLRRVPFRQVGINFTWKFGKLEFKKEKEDNKEPATSTPEGQ